MSANDFKQHFGPPDTHDATRWEYRGDGLVVVVRAGTIQEFQFYVLPLNGFSVAAIGLDRGFDRQQSVRELYKTYGASFKAADDRYVFRSRGGQIVYSYKYGDRVRDACGVGQSLKINHSLTSSLPDLLLLWRMVARLAAGRPGS